MLATMMTAAGRKASCPVSDGFGANPVSGNLAVEAAAIAAAAAAAAAASACRRGEKILQRSNPIY